VYMSGQIMFLVKNFKRREKNLKLHKLHFSHTVFVIIIIIIRHKLDLDRPVSASFISLFKVLPSRLLQSVL
jgi:hypothetical protein